MITIVDSGIANIASVQRACEYIGAEVRATRDPDAVASAHALILPGVGSFADGMASLRSSGLERPIRQAGLSGVPILGICLGMQLMARSSEEFGDHEGLGLFPGRVSRLQAHRAGERVPNIGWCGVALPRQSRLFEGIDNDSTFYFMHSYFLRCDDAEDMTGVLAFGQGAVCVAFERANLFGVQFHPEKSQDPGLRLLNNFTRVAGEKGK